MNKPLTSLLLGPFLTAAATLAPFEAPRAEQGLPDAASDASGDSPPDAPYIASPDYVVERMLELGQVGPGDYVIDLGSGDGRIPIAAAQRGAYGLGVDIDSELVRRSRERAAEAGVDDRVMFLEQNLFETDIRQASVVTMYLLQSLNLKLRPRLLEELRPGTRVVSHNYDMGEWEPDARVRFGKSEALPWNVIYAWVIPADVAGQWRWQVEGARFRWQVEQRFQKLFTRLESGGATLTPENVELRGRRIGLTAEHDGTRYVFGGRAEGNRIEGIVKVRSGDRRRMHPWTAERQ